MTFFGSLKSIHVTYKHNYGEVIEEELGDAKNSLFCVADSVTDRLLSSSLAHQAPLWIHQVNDAHPYVLFSWFLLLQGFRQSFWNHLLGEICEMNV